MSEMVITEKSDLVAIADAIREQTGETEGMKITAMPPKIRSIVGGGSGSGINVTGATKGQMIIVKDVDSDGKPTAWEAVNRLAWSECRTGEKLYSVENGSFSDTLGFMAHPLPKVLEVTSDSIYTVVWNGKEYTCTGFNFGHTQYIGNYSILGLGGDDTGEPFVYAYLESVGAPFMVDGNGASSNTFSISKADETIHMIDPKYYERLAWVEGSNKVPLNITSDPSKALSTMDLGEGISLLRMSDDVLTLDELLQCYGQVVNVSENFEQTMSFAEAYEAGMITEMPGLIMAQEMVIMVTDVTAANSLGLPFTFDHVGIYMAYMEGVTVRLYSDTVMMGTEVVHKIDNKFIDAEWMATGGQEQYEGEILAESNFVGGGMTYTDRAINYDKVNEGDGVVVVWDGQEYHLEVKHLVYAGILKFLYAGNIGGAYGKFFTGLPVSDEPFLIVFGQTDIEDTSVFHQVCDVQLADVYVEGMTHTVSIYAKPIINKLPNKYLDLDWIPKVESEDKVFTFDGDFNANGWVEYAGTKLTSVSTYIPTNDELYASSFTIVGDNAVTVPMSECWDLMVANGKVTDDYVTILFYPDEDTSIFFGCVVKTAAGAYEFGVAGTGIYFASPLGMYINNLTIHGKVDTLPEKFIPDTIQKVGEPVYLTSPNGTKFVLAVADDGTLSATAVA